MPPEENIKNESTEFEMLSAIRQDVAVIKNELTHLPTSKEYTEFKIEFAAFKSRVMTIGTCLVFASGIVGLVVSLVSK